MDTKYYIFIVKNDDGTGIISESDVVAMLEFDTESTRDCVFYNNLKINAGYYTFEKANGNIENEEFKTA
jgi:hypothetical protein